MYWASVRIYIMFISGIFDIVKIATYFRLGYSNILYFLSFL